MRLKARDVLRKYWDGHLPVKPDVIARAMGVEVSFAVESTTEPLCICRVEKVLGKPLISCRPQMEKIRERYVIAHALGHYCLGHIDDNEKIIDTAKCYNSKSFDLSEIEANQFATELLVPELAAKFLVRSIFNISVLARRFVVSEVAMRWRLQKLGILS